MQFVKFLLLLSLSVSLRLQRHTAKTLNYANYLHTSTLPWFEYVCNLIPVIRLNTLISKTLSPATTVVGVLILQIITVHYRQISSGKRASAFQFVNTIPSYRICSACNYRCHPHSLLLLRAPHHILTDPRITLAPNGIVLCCCCDRISGCSLVVGDSL